MMIVTHFVKGNVTANRWIQWPSLVGVVLSVILINPAKAEDKGPCLAEVCSDEAMMLEVIHDTSGKEIILKPAPTSATLVSHAGTKHVNSFYATTTPEPDKKLILNGPSTIQLDSITLLPKPVRFDVLTNYGDFIAGWMLKVYEKSETGNKRLIWSATGTQLGKAIIWQPQSNEVKLGDELVYQVELTGKQGGRDLSLERLVTVITDLSVNNDQTTPSDQPMIWGVDLALRNDLLSNQIIVNGAQVRISGEASSPNAIVTIDGVKVQSDSHGIVTYITHKTPGHYEFSVETATHQTEPQMVGVDVAEGYFLLAALADITIGEGTFSGDKAIWGTLGEDRQYDDDIHIDGRLAFYFKGRIKGKYLLTAQADTDEVPLDQLFNQFNERDATTLLRQIDPDRYYFVYGDTSHTVSDVNTQGKFYVRLDWDRSSMTWGNYNTNLTGTDLLDYNRGLYGAKLDYRSVAQTKFDDSRIELTGFVSEPNTIAGEDEFLATGGSLYYLRRADIVEGSDRVRVEVRERNTGRVRSISPLTIGKDYEFDAIQGRIILTRPLAQKTLETAGPSIVNEDNVLDGDDIFLIVGYEYLPNSLVDGVVNAGGRAKVWLTDHFAVGATQISEDQAGTHFNKAGGEITAKLSEQSYLRAEFAQTEGRRQVEAYRSNNGGLGDFTSIQQTATGNVRGDGVAVNGVLALTDLAINQDGQVEVFYRDQDAQFDRTTDQSGEDYQLYGARFSGQLAKNVRLRLEGIQEVTGTIDETRRSGAQLDWNLWNGKVTIGGEYRRVDDLLSSTFVDYAGVRTDVQLTPNVRAYVKGQTVIGEEGYVNQNSNDTQSDQVTLGVDSRIGQGFHMIAEVSDGDNGQGGRVGLNMTPIQGQEVYVNYTLADYADGRDEGVTLGHRGRLTDRASVYQEYQWDTQNTELNNQDGIDRLWGLNYQLSKGWQLGASYGRNTTNSLINGGRIDRDVSTISADYQNAGIRFGTRLEYRNDQNVSNDQLNIKQYLLRSKLRYGLDDDYTALAGLDIVKTVSQDFNDNEALARFIELELGMAYRPIRNDRFNALFMYTHLLDEDPDTQVGANFNERSHIASLETTFEIDRHWEIGNKIAFKRKEQQAGMNDSWLRNDLTLGVIRLRYHVLRHWDGIVEYRLLHNNTAKVNLAGAVVGISRHLGQNMDIGVGYNFSQFSSNLAREDYDAQGWFVNLVGKY